MRLRGLLLSLVLAGCIDDDLVPCGNGLACPAGRTCVLLTEPDETVCASDEQLAACDGMEDGVECTAELPGVCRNRACTPIVCGNARVDPGEACDDGNLTTGDGLCSADCLSNEACGNGTVDPLVLVN